LRHQWTDTSFLGPVLTALALRRLGFDERIERHRDALLFLFASAVTMMIVLPLGVIKVVLPSLFGSVSSVKSVVSILLLGLVNHREISVRQRYRGGKVPGRCPGRGGVTKSG
jgi:hypothetical protein